MGNVVRDVCRADMLGHALGIFGVIVIETALGLQFGNSQRAVADHCGGQLTPPDKGFGEQLVKLLPRPCDIASDRIALIAARRHDSDTDRRPFIDRLQHIGARQRIAEIQAFGLHDMAAGHANAMRSQRLLGQLLVDGDH